MYSPICLTQVFLSFIQFQPVLGLMQPAAPVFLTDRIHFFVFLLVVAALGVACMRCVDRVETHRPDTKPGSDRVRVCLIAYIDLEVKAQTVRHAQFMRKVVRKCIARLVGNLECIFNLFTDVEV